MKTIEYKGQKITPIMKPMLVWHDDEKLAEIKFIVCKNEPSKYPWMAINSMAWINAKPLPRTKTRTIEDGLEVGDIISKDDFESKVLGICGEAIFTSLITDFKRAAASVYTLHELIVAGWKLKQPEQDSE